MTYAVADLAIASGRSMADLLEDDPEDLSTMLEVRAMQRQATNGQG